MSEISLSHAFLALLAIILGTIITRFLPLAIFSFFAMPLFLVPSSCLAFKKDNTLHYRHACSLPIYKDVNLASTPFGSYEGLGVFSVIAIYLIFIKSPYNGLLAIFISTLFYILLLYFKPFG
ncbi:hypothetical protein BKH43_00840 [Helicobacter sp. 13S00401-1]|uniref:hypothetical protein n=1 Tax=Helicobacter sp. 13S00401-1 TaxID=1905758 RepID=UPI000BA6195C|nr:hypothetical protein [Helicobacter sp. 13S00401-1]PAF51813.1 hypothetical protein BKH43_00840 [Helicobacter sp. 13S00401-1]